MGEIPHKEVNLRIDFFLFNIELGMLLSKNVLLLSNFYITAYQKNHILRNVRGKAQLYTSKQKISVFQNLASSTEFKRMFTEF